MSRKSKWTDRLPEIRKLAGTMPAADVAKVLETTPGNLAFVCSKHDISLRFPATASPPPRKNARKPAAKAMSSTQKTDQLVKRIAHAAGTMPATEIAEKFGMTVKALRCLCSKRGISLKRTQPAAKPPTPIKPRQHSPSPATLETQLENASIMLRKHGYTVLRPCPFRTHIDSKRSRTGSLPRE